LNIIVNAVAIWDQSNRTFWWGWTCLTNSISQAERVAV